MVIHFKASKNTDWSTNLGSIKQLLLLQGDFYLYVQQNKLLKLLLNFIFFDNDSWNRLDIEQSSIYKQTYRKLL